MIRIARGMLGAMALAGLAGAASAAGGGVAVPSPLAVPLACTIWQVKVMKITNSSGMTIPAGTRISWSIELYDHSHHAGSFVAGPVAPGTVMPKGVPPSLSCTASFTKKLSASPAL